MRHKIPKINFEIIFCTAYDAFALTAFEFYTIDYLLKHVSKDKLIRAVDKVRQKQHKQVDLQNIELLLANMRVCFLGYCLLFGQLKIRRIFN